MDLDESLRPYPVEQASGGMPAQLGGPWEEFREPGNEIVHRVQTVTDLQSAGNPGRNLQQTAGALRGFSGSVELPGAASPRLLAAL